jgi:hypothetical protein
MRRLVRALKTVPRRSWWVIALPLAFLALLAVDRHLAATAFAAWVGYRVLRFQRRRARDAAKARNKEIRWRNPSTGLPMLFNNLGGVDTAGYYFNEDTLDRHRGDEG